MNLRSNLPPIPFIDVAAQRRRLGPAIDAAVARVLDHCQFIMGPEVRAFESELASFCGARHVISCASGTDALVLALRAMGVGPGDAVLCPSFTFCATAEVAALVGATPIFVDVDAVYGKAGACEFHSKRQADIALPDHGDRRGSPCKTFFQRHEISGEGPPKLRGMGEADDSTTG